MAKDFNIVDSGYADSKQEFEGVKAKWKAKDPSLKVKRVKTDTKGLIMYWVIKEV